MSRETDKEAGFLSRWSQRKRGSDTMPEPDTSSFRTGTDIESPETSKIKADADEKTEQPLPVWQRDDVDADTKKAALRKLFRKPEFNVRDGLNEYDDDFTQFASLGTIVTHEMKRLLKLAEEKTRPEEQKESHSSTSTEETGSKPNSKEDDGIA
ncbi:DUF3306 domain-containing protein [Methylophaga sp.]|uniref:DUF3306 domain-containing protein n=1 Tax=Methylophaga sp. TaxID=2024840 RepID=UPI003F6A0308